jgi:hypothetical protein
MADCFDANYVIRRTLLNGLMSDEFVNCPEMTEFHEHVDTEKQQVTMR